MSQAKWPTSPAHVVGFDNGAMAGDAGVPESILPLRRVSHARELCPATTARISGGCADRAFWLGVKPARDAAEFIDDPTPSEVYGEPPPPPDTDHAWHPRSFRTPSRAAQTRLRAPHLLILAALIVGMIVGAAAVALTRPEGPSRFGTDLCDLAGDADLPMLKRWWR